MPKKSDIVNGTYKLIRISGLTSEAIPEEIETALQVADDYAGELLATGLDIGWLQPLEYGLSDPDDISGLSALSVGAFKKLLAIELVDYFGKVAPMSLQANASKGMRSLEQLFVNVRPTQNPATLPVGSGNEWDYRSDKFYPEPISDDGAIYKYLTDVFQLDISWSDLVGGEGVLTNVTYELDSEITVSSDSFSDRASNATISFTKTGQFTLCATGTSDAGNVSSKKYIYNVTKCMNNYYP